MPEKIDRIRNYEAFYIVAATLSDADIQKIADKFKGVVENQGGTVASAGKWDKRKLAYEIDGHKEGNYILMNFSAESRTIAEVDRLMRINDDVVRHRIYKIED
jgi:small subunit ribosomal protein S6